MSTTIEAQGRTIDEAIQVALNQLGTSRDKVDIEIVHHPRAGFLGIGARRAKVRATLRRGVMLDGEEFDMSASSDLSEKPRRRRRRGGRGRGTRAEGGETRAPEEKERRADSGGREQRGGREEQRPREDQRGRQRDRDREKRPREEQRGRGRDDQRREDRPRDERGRDERQNQERPREERPREERPREERGRGERGGRDRRGGRGQGGEGRDRRGRSQEPRGERPRGETRQADAASPGAESENREHLPEPAQRAELPRWTRNDSSAEGAAGQGAAAEPTPASSLGGMSSAEPGPEPGSDAEEARGAAGESVDLETARERALQIVQDLMSRMGFPCDVAAEIDDVVGEVVVSVRADSEGLLIGRRGQTLDSLEHIVNRMVMRGEGSGDGRVLLDIGDYRRRRREALIDLAQRLRGRALGEQRTVQVSPMSPRDRKFFQQALAAEADVEVRALGAGFYRRMIVAPAGMGAAAMAEAERAGSMEDEEGPGDLHDSSADPEQER
ncbi:MAG TPA: RNA-binding cell elongation regulator Jag/EloR [Candidatus Limnocylindrales bacterium]|nr:RNA-binding cell elongation regulator Jag/EloR [Candidatus Limnocylindrales bacterium]